MTLSRYVRGILRPARAAFTEPSVYALLIWDEPAVAFTLPSQLRQRDPHPENKEGLNIDHNTNFDETSSSYVLLVVEE
jgi:hypothetical protein